MITVEDVKDHLGLPQADTYDDQALAKATAAANDLVVTYRPDMATVDPWPARVIQAGVLWAARLYGRRNSVEGLAGFQDIGAIPITRVDPDIQALLELGSNQRSVVA